MFDSETSPHRRPFRCSWTSKTTMASTSRLTVSWRTPRLNKRPVRQGELQMPSDQNRVERLALFINTSCDHTHRLD